MSERTVRNFQVNVGENCLPRIAQTTRPKQTIRNHGVVLDQKANRTRTGGNSTQDFRRLRQLANRSSPNYPYRINEISLGTRLTYKNEIKRFD